MLAYLDINHPFIPNMDSSDTQLGGLLVQVNPNTKVEKTISTFSWKLNLAQLNYLIMDKELLGIAESLNHFHNIIYGAEILVQMDHKNICHEDTKHTSQWVFHQHILISQEYGKKIECYEGKNNTGADGLSWLPRSNMAILSSQAEIYAQEPVSNREAVCFPLDLQVIAQAKCTYNDLQVLCTNPWLQNKISFLEQD